MEKFLLLRSSLKDEYGMLFEQAYEPEKMCIRISPSEGDRNSRILGIVLFQREDSWAASLPNILEVSSIC